LPVATPDRLVADGPRPDLFKRSLPRFFRDYGSRAPEDGDGFKSHRTRRCAMAEIYTSGSWVVKEGREKEFIDAWRDLAEWTKVEIGGAGNPVLLRDGDNPRRFLSFGPWDDVEAVEAWRTSEGFQLRIGKVRELLEDLEVRTLDPVLELG
jgi:quinol monooxygenase YgiN